MFNPFIYNAIVLDVYDGDTVTLNIDCGFDIWFKVKARLSGINAPELRGAERPAGLKTKEFLSTLIKGQMVVVETEKDSTEKFGRYLVTIWYQGKNINQLLMEKGLAKKYV